MTTYIEVNSDRTVVPANKFYPPRLIAEQTLERSNLLSTICPVGESFQYIIFEAQAGQGKTTTAIQFLEKKAGQYVWIQMGPEDIDPIFFVTSLLRIFSQSIRGFSSDSVLTQLETGQTMAFELPQLLALFLSDLDTFLQNTKEEQGITLVFDDLHRVINAQYTMGLIDQLLEDAPKKLSILLLSRQPVAVKSKRVRSGGSTMYLGNSELALAKDEIVELLGLLLNKLPDPVIVEQIVQQSAGWPMGIVLAAKHAIGSAQGWEKMKPEARSYFTEELFSAFTDEEKKTILRLSLLDEIPLEIGHRLCPEEDVAALLHSLAERNFFLRYLNDEGTSFGFHHYFLTFLRETAHSVLGREEILSLRRLSARFYLDHGMIGKAMWLYLEAGDFSALEETFEQFGTSLVARNRHVTIGSVLAGIPEEIIIGSAWFSYFSGLVLQGNDPRNSLPHLLRARELFLKAGNKRDELLVVGSIIYLYIIHSQELPRAQVIHPDSADKLFQEVGNELASYSRITTANNIALGYLYFMNNFKKALHYNRLVEVLVAEQNLPNLLVESRGASAWTYSMLGDFSKGIKIVEENFRLIKRKELGMLSRIYLYFLQIDYIRHLADRDNFVRQRDECIAAVGLDFLRSSFIYPFLVLFDIELSFSKGKIRYVRHLIAEHKDSNPFDKPGFFRGELLGWQGLCLALDGVDGKVLSGPVAEVEQWLEIGASPLHQCKAMLLLGSIDRLREEYEQGLACYNRAINIAEQIGLDQMLGRAYLHRALLHQEAGNRKASVTDALSGIQLFKEKLGYNHIFAFTPAMFMRVMNIGYGAGEKSFCHRYAWEHMRIAISGDHNIPALQVQILGGFSLSVHGEADRLVMGDLSRNQRRLFGLLLQSSRGEISQIEAQIELWPDIGEKKARPRFDTMMTRLRKLMSEVVAPNEVNDYLNVRKGMVVLNHCLVDAHEFCKKVDRGLVHLERGEWWQASNKFTSALELWQGEVASAMLEIEEYSAVVRDPLIRIVSMAEKWCPVLIGLNRIEEATNVCEAAWRVCGDNIHLTRLLYGLYLQDGAVREARQVIGVFRKKSLELDLDEETVEASVQSIISAAGVTG